MRRGAAPPAQRGWPHGVLAAAAGRQCRRCYAMQRQLLEIARYACRLRLPICSVSIRETVCPPAHDGDGSALAESAQRWMTSARPADTRAEHDELQGGCLGLGAELRALCEARRLCEAARQEAAAAAAAAAGSQPAARSGGVVKRMLCRYRVWSGWLHTCMLTVSARTRRRCAQTLQGRAPRASRRSPPSRRASCPSCSARPAAQASHADLAAWTRSMRRGAQRRAAHTPCPQ